MKSNRLASLFILSAFFGSVALAQEGVSYSMTDLREMDPTIDQQLAQAGYEGDTESLQLNVEGDPARPTFEVQTSPQSARSCVGLNCERKSLWVAGVICSSVYLQGVGFSYLHLNPKKQKIIYHVDATVAGNPETSNLTIAFDAHIGKWGLFAGLNGQLIRYQSKLIDHSTAVLLPAGGIEAGWQKEWGARRRVVTKIKFGALISYYQAYTYVIPEGSVGVGLNLSSFGHQ